MNVSDSLIKLKKYNPTQQEFEIGQWLIFNVAELKLIKSCIINNNLFDKSYADLKRDAIATNLLDSVRLEASQTFTLTPEELNGIITQEFIVMLLGEDFFYAN